VDLTTTNEDPAQEIEDLHERAEDLAARGEKERATALVRKAARIRAEIEEG
jgi:hypothetical protein